MGIEEHRRTRLANQQPLPLIETPHEGRHPHRIVARGSAEPLAERISLALHVTTVGRERRGPRPGQREAAFVTRHGLLLSRVPLGDVGDLVAEHAGELVLVVHERQQSARHVDMSARKRERIRLHLVHDREVVGEVTARQTVEELFSDVFDIRRQLRIVEQANLRYAGNFTLRRLPPYEPSEEDLSAFAGLYYSPELESVYTITIADNRLSVKHPSGFVTRLAPKEPDMFSGGYLGEYRFERNDDGNVSGFVAESVLFEKLK